MPPETNKAIIRQVIEEIVNQGNLSIIEDVFSPTFVDRSTPDQPPGPEGVKAFVSLMRARLPDLHIDIDDLIAEGDKVVVRTTWRGTLQGQSQARRTMIQIFRLADGKIVEEWNEGEGLL
ncbi:MAG TPA: ester cyclase [Ktedonobacterales bacterium]|jgi:predicted SnoaL-like aldol condensation-catalyzing enzyme